MLTYGRSTIATDTTHVRSARENIHSYEKVSCSQLYEGKTTVIKLGKARTENVTKANLNVNFTITKDGENETYLGDVIGNTITENQTFDKAIYGKEKLGER